MKEQTKNSRWWILWSIFIIILLIGLTYSFAWGQPFTLNKFEADNDKQLRLALIEQYQNSPELNADWIDVDVEDQVATLSGHVNTLIAKEKAEEIANETKGIRSVINKIYVVPLDRTDAKIRSDVSRALLMDTSTERYELVVLVEDQIVTLRGQVDSWVERDIAEHLAKEIVGVEKVINQITVNYDENRSDFEIAQDVRTRLKNDARIHDDLIDVEVNNDVVVLKGVVSTIAEKERAIELAWTTGVSDVNAEELQVDYLAFQNQEGQMADEVNIEESNRIESIVNEAIQDNPKVSADQVSAFASDGIVTLTGTVETLDAKNSLEQDLESLTGIIRVKNFLTVRSDEIIGSENEITQAVLANFRSNAYFRESGIDVSYKDGTVYLEGVVDSVFEKEYAKEIASRTEGVEKVVNRIMVGTEWADKTDQELKADVLRELWWTPYVERENVNVNVEDGVVRLSGTVDSLHARWEAEQNAYEAGAKDVNNLLEVAQTVEANQ